MGKAKILKDFSQLVNLMEVENEQHIKEKEVKVKATKDSVTKVNKPIKKEWRPKPKKIDVAQEVIHVKKEVVDKKEVVVLEKTEESKKEYQKQWQFNMEKHRKMISKKNKKWLEDNSSNTEFKDYKPFPEFYNKINVLFNDESKRKWILHLIANFLPLNKSKQVPKLPNKVNCKITDLPLTDFNSILTGDRDKHIAYTGEKTDALISGIALQELNRFVCYCIDNYETKEGQIVNYLLDKIRTNN